MRVYKYRGLKLMLGVSIVVCTVFQPVIAQLPHTDTSNAGKWILNEEMSDEFKGSVLDEEKWLIQGRDGEYRSNWIGRAPSQFSTENVRLEDGKLKLETRWEPDYEFSTKPDKDGVTYENITTAAVISRKQFLYGYMEIKCKAADASVQSSFWMTGSGAELDVFEFNGNPSLSGKDHLLKQHWCSIHDWRPGKGGASVWTNKMQLPWKVASEFHTYSCEWDKNYVKFYADGILITEATKAELGSNWVLSGPLWIWVDNETFPWQGIPTEADLTADYEIEYIRVWQKEGAYKPKIGEIANPGFENGSMSFWTESYGKISAVTNNVHSGNFVGKVLGKSAIEQLVEVKPNTTYVLSSWGKVAKEGDYAFLGVSKIDGKNVNAKIENTEYEQKTITFTTGNTTTANIWLYSDKANTEAYIDDFRLYEKDSVLISVKNVSVTPTTLELAIGKTSQLNERILPDTASYKSVVWESSNTLVAEVDGFGIVKGIAEGKALIIVKSVEDKDLADTSEVTVISVPVTKITVTPADISMEIGETYALKATILPNDATDKSVTWESESNLIATVDSDGQITAIAEGTTRIMAKSVVNNSIEASCAIAVNGASLINNHQQSSKVNLQLYPNPYNGSDLELIISRKADVTIAIYSSEGRVIYSDDFFNKSEIHISGTRVKLNKGIYIVKAQSEMFSVTQKLIVN